MDQLGGTGIDQGTATTGMTGGGGMQGTNGAAGAQQMGGTGGAADGFVMPEKFKNSTPESIARSYVELEKKLGKLPEMEQHLQKWQQFGQAWDPILRQVGYDPQRLATTLEQAARAAAQRGDTQQAQQLHQQAQQQQAKAWSDLVDPREQEQWLRDYTGQQVQGVEQKLTQAIMQQVVPQIMQYVNNYGDLALRAIDKKFSNPNLDLGQYLQEAVNYVSGRYDPMDLAFQRMTAEAPKQLEERIRSEERAKVMQEMKNQQLTTGVGVGATPTSRTLRPPVATTTGGASRQAEAVSMAQAKDRFLKKVSSLPNE